MKLVMLFTIMIVVHCANLRAQGLVLNEISNGTAGSKEFMEFVVDGPPCTDVDIRLWIIDDNNGDFSCGPCASSGIATGHLRFANVALWSAVPTGSIIVIYNELDVDAGILPAADPTDANSDGVYVIPSSNINLEYSTTPCLNPNSPTALGSCPGPCTGTDTYGGVCYTSGGNGWATLGLRNTGDAGQSRTPGGVYYHGFAFGTPANNMSGGVDGLIDPIAGGNLSFFFDNSISNDYRDVNNWSSIAAASATPGAPNNPNNSTWINSFDCPLPVQLIQNSVTCYPTFMLLEWSTASEFNNSHFNIHKSLNGYEYTLAGSVPGSENSNSMLNYSFMDNNIYLQSYYRIEQVDMNGKSEFYPPLYSNCDASPNENSLQAYVYSFKNGTLNIGCNSTSEQELKIDICDITGRIAFSKMIQVVKGNQVIEIDFNPQTKGIYLISLIGYDCSIHFKHRFL